MKETYDAVVIGTGFGGAVASCRLAQAGLSVAVLERGRRYDKRNPSDNRFPFPRDFKKVENGWLYAHDQGLFDVKPIEEMLVVECAGYGGGSLIYANVHLRAPADVFANGWPSAYSREALDPYYDLVAYMLDIAPITSRPKDQPAKTKLMAAMAERLGRAKQLYYPNIAVDLSDARDGLHANKFGVQQQGCSNCGECDIGCPFGSKNTLDLNYLAIAEREGAHVATQCEVVRIEPSADGGYVVAYRDFAEKVERKVTAKAVFVCAGAVNTTELLLRCRDIHRTLPGLSPALGKRYSGNGDLLAFGFDTTEDFKPEYGPTITTGVVYDDRAKGDARTWFTFQEGGYPKQIAGLFQLLREGGSWWPAAGNLVREEVDGAIKKVAGAAAENQPTAGDLAKLQTSAVFLAMGRDLANGQIDLHPVTKRLRIRWDLGGNLPLYDTEDRLARDVVQALGGKPAENPLWRLLSQPVSVHNLGGCCMADDANDGVTDANGEIHGCPNLFVLDGASLPAATGVNPAHTIAAVAERNVEHFIRRWRHEPSWAPPERSKAKRIVDPLERIEVPAGGTAPPSSLPVGLQFTETMKGFLSPADAMPADLAGYLAAEEAGKRAEAAAQFTLTITTGDLDRFLADKMHAARAEGSVKDSRLAPAGAPVTAGIFNLFIVDGPHRRRMVYSLPFVGADGRRYLLDGFKDVVDHHFDVWPATSTLYTVVRAGSTHDAPVCAAGVLRILKTDFAHQLTTFRFPGAASGLERVRALGHFGRMFAGALWDVFVADHLPGLPWAKD